MDRHLTERLALAPGLAARFCLTGGAQQGCILRVPLILRRVFAAHVAASFLRPGGARRFRDPECGPARWAPRSSRWSRDCFPHPHARCGDLTVSFRLFLTRTPGQFPSHTTTGPAGRTSGRLDAADSRVALSSTRAGAPQRRPPRATTKNNYPRSAPAQGPTHSLRRLALLRNFVEREFAIGISHADAHTSAEAEGCEAGVGRACARCAAIESDGGRQSQGKVQREASGERQTHGTR